MPPIYTATGLLTEAQPAFVIAAESSGNVKVHAASGYRGVYPERADGRSSLRSAPNPAYRPAPVTCRNCAAPICRRKVSMSK